MIPRRELTLLAAASGVDEKAQEHDYVLTWLLAARSTLGPSTLVFKGGTALKKCYFKDYRYSEDLDFTLDDKGNLGEVPGCVRKWFEFVRNESGVDCSFEKEPEFKPGTLKCDIRYVALLPRNRTIKVDVTDAELLVEPAERRPLLADYSDVAGREYCIETYGLAEIFAEKVRSLVQRSEPRDLYDLVEISEHDRNVAANALPVYLKKISDKGVAKDRLLERFDSSEALFKKNWETRLAPHVRDLGQFDDYWRRGRRALRVGGYL